MKKLCLTFILALLFPLSAQAYTHSFSTDIWREYEYGNYINNIIAIGYNKSEGFAKLLKTSYYRNNDDHYVINVYLPDDGSTWDITCVVSYHYIRRSVIDGDTEYLHGESNVKTYQATVTTSGIFDGVSIGKAVNAAEDAAAKAGQAKNSADIASSNTYDLLEGKTVAVIAKEARDKASAVETKVDNLQTDISDLQTIINNINGSDTTPPTVEVETVSGARATSANEIDVYINVSDNKPGPYEYKYTIDSYSSPWRTIPSDGKVTFGHISTGINKFYVQVKDAAGNIGSDNITIRGL